MKKTWKQWIAIACVLSMIACMLPAMTLAEEAEEQPATPTDLMPVNEYLIGDSAFRGTLLAGQDCAIVLHSDRNWNILVSLLLTAKEGQRVNGDSVQVSLDGIRKELTRIENEDPDSPELLCQFETYAAQDKDYILVIKSRQDADFILTAVKRPEPETEEPAEEKNEEPAEERDEEPAETGDAEGAEEQDEGSAVRAWVSGTDNPVKAGTTVTLNAEAEPELEGVATWYVRNEEVEEGAWKKAGYGSHLTIEAAEGNEYRFVLQDGTVSETFRLIIAAEEIPEDLHEETEDAEEVEQNPDEDNTDPEGESEDALTEESETPAELEETANVEEPDENEDAEEKSEGAENADVTNEEENKDSEEETQEEEQEEEPEEEAEILPDPEELLALGYYGTQVVMSNGADVYESTEEDAEPVEHLEAGTELWVIPTETEGWAEIYRTDEETPVRYIRWDDVIINQKPETEDEEEEEELPARSVEITSNIVSMDYIPLGTKITMTAELINFREDDECVFQWMYYDESIKEYVEIDGADEQIYTYSITLENICYNWKLVVTILND